MIVEPTKAFIKRKKNRNISKNISNKSEEVTREERRAMSREIFLLAEFQKLPFSIKLLFNRCGPEPAVNMDKTIFENELATLVRFKMWKSVLMLEKEFEQNVTANYLWCYPRESCLIDLKNAFNHLKIRRIMSVGCGTGLLEWILQCSLGKSVTFCAKKIVNNSLHIFRIKSRWN